MFFDQLKDSPLRSLLLPFSWLAGFYIRCRNYLFDKKIIPSAQFNFPIICIGNLSTGGTGKSPMTEYLIRLLMPGKKIAVLSRGYKRKTKGYLLATNGTTALEIGDEPMQFYKKFPELTVAVCEDRAAAIPMILHDRPETGVILLDDAFQHRHVHAGLNIVLTEFANPFWKDNYLPAGNLRDNPSSISRAQIVVVTKCPDPLDETLRDACVRMISPDRHQHVFFTTIRYGTPYHILDRSKSLNPDADTFLLLVTGIANPEPLQQKLKHAGAPFDSIIFPDHHIFSIDDLARIKERFDQIPQASKLMITTEKDAVRFEKFGDALKGMPLYVVPIVHHFLFDGHELFCHTVEHFVQSLPAQSISTP